MKDIDYLEEVGISVLVDGEEVCFKVILSAVLGDNLASQYLEEYKSLASAHRKCCSCFAIKEDMQTKHIASLSQNTALQQHISSTYGINEDSILHQSLYFHVSEGVTPDIMHNVLEGCLQYEMKEIVQHQSKNAPYDSPLRLDTKMWPLGSPMVYEI
uniref:Uncharacterized protein n=1 Tax=Amphimedon queenslandica TaxID=400682 RepID=A0A1X7U9I7_AMPQE